MPIEKSSARGRRLAIAKHRKKPTEPIYVRIEYPAINIRNALKNLPDKYSKIFGNMTIRDIAQVCSALNIETAIISEPNKEVNPNG